MAQTSSSTYSFSSAPKAVGARKKYREPGPVDTGLYRSVPRQRSWLPPQRSICMQSSFAHCPGEGDMHFVGQACPSREHLQHVHPKRNQGGGTRYHASRTLVPRRVKCGKAIEAAQKTQAHLCKVSVFLSGIVSLAFAGLPEGCQETETQGAFRLCPC